jgi:hypothetical protein
MKEFFKIFLKYKLRVTDLFLTKEIKSEYTNHGWKFNTIIHKTKLGEWVLNKPIILYGVIISILWILLYISYIIYFPFYLLYLLFRKKESFE